MYIEYKGPHKKTRGADGLGSDYYFTMNTMIGKGKCAI